MTSGYCNDQDRLPDNTKSHYLQGVHQRLKERNLGIGLGITFKYESSTFQVGIVAFKDMKQALTISFGFPKLYSFTCFMQSSQKLLHAKGFSMYCDHLNWYKIQ